MQLIPSVIPMPILSQALRILNLLEQHHKKLGHILKSRHEHPLVERVTALESQKPQAAAVESSAAVPGAIEVEKRATSPEASQHPPHLPHAPRFPAREPSSSIASNLAKARGIPGRQQRPGVPVSPAVSTQHAGGRFSNEQATLNQAADATGKGGKLGLDTEHHARPSWTPPTAVSETNDPTSDDTKTSPTDAPFQQFYSTFESLISKISAPLAFAGLPLTATSTAVSTPSKPPPAIPAPKAKAKGTKPSAPLIPVSADSVDYSQLISQAALRAVRDGIPTNPAESFFLVPTSGGAEKYSDILKGNPRENNRHNRHLSNISEDNDDFVDARETVPSPVVTEVHATGSAAHSRRGSGKLGPVGKETPKVAGKTMEELSLENQTLRQYLDSTSKRLRVFELSAQSSSAALAQSIRSLQRSPVSTPENSRGKGDSGSGRGKGDEKARARITELEEILRKNDKELQKREKENAKLKDVVVRYREKWEKLKEGARARREGGGSSGGDRTPKVVEEGIED